MDALSYVNIFSTKGVEYLIVISFFILLIPFWRFLQETEEPVYSMSRLRIPLGIFFDSTHSWAFLETAGKIRVGVDDFLTNITGPATLKPLKHNGDHVVRGETISLVEAGGRQLKIYAPLSGTVSRLNRKTIRRFGKTTQAAFSHNWLLKISPDRWEQEQSYLMRGKQTRAWMKTELNRLRDFLAFSAYKFSPDLPTVLLQEGGELADHLLAELPDEIWLEFQAEFLDGARIQPER